MSWDREAGDGGKGAMPNDDDNRGNDDHDTDDGNFINNTSSGWAHVLAFVSPEFAGHNPMYAACACHHHTSQRTRSLPCGGGEGRMHDIRSLDMCRRAAQERLLAKSSLQGCAKDSLGSPTRSHIWHDVAN